MLDFADTEDIADWALEGVMFCRLNEIIGGRSSDNGIIFDPKGYATRAEIAAMLQRYIVWTEL